MLVAGLMCALAVADANATANATIALKLSMTVQGIDCAGLSANESIKEGFEGAVGATLADSVGVEEVFLNLSCGSVIVEVLIEPSSSSFGAARVSLRGWMREGGAQLITRIVGAIEAVPGIGMLKSGDIVVEGMQAFVVEGDTQIEDLQASGSCSASEEAQVDGINMCTCVQANDWVACYSKLLVSSGIPASCTAAVELRNVIARTDCACTLKAGDTCAFEKECSECNAVTTASPTMETTEASTSTMIVLIVVPSAIVVLLCATFFVGQRMRPMKRPAREVASSYCEEVITL